MAQTLRDILDEIYGTEQPSLAPATTLTSVLDEVYGGEEPPSLWERAKTAVPSVGRGALQLGGALATGKPAYQRHGEEVEPWVASLEAGMTSLGRGMLTAGIAPPSEIERQHPVASAVGQAVSLPVAGLTGVGALPAVSRAVARPLLGRAATGLGRMAVEAGIRGGIGAGVTAARGGGGRDVAQAALSAIASVFPEYGFTPGAVNLIGQVGTDVVIDAILDTLRRKTGEGDIPPVISADWLIREIPQLIPSVTYATMDVTPRGRMELAAKQGRAPKAETRPGVEIVRPEDLRVPETEAPVVEPTTASAVRVRDFQQERERLGREYRGWKARNNRPEMDRVEVEMAALEEQIRTLTGLPLTPPESAVTEPIPQRAPVGLEPEVARIAPEVTAQTIEAFRAKGIREGQEDLVVGAQLEDYNDLYDRGLLGQISPEDFRAWLNEGREKKVSEADFREQRLKILRDSIDSSHTVYSLQELLDYPEILMEQGIRPIKTHSDLRAAFPIKADAIEKELTDRGYRLEELPVPIFQRLIQEGTLLGEELKALGKPMSRKPAKPVEAEEPPEDVIEPVPIETPRAEREAPAPAPAYREADTWPRFLRANGLYLRSSDVQELYPDLPRSDRQLWLQVVRSEDKGGRPLDEVADELARQGILRVPEAYGDKPSDYLMELLKTRSPMAGVEETRVPESEAVPVGDLGQGDRFKIHGVEHFVERITPDGAVITNGDREQVDVFDRVEIDPGTLRKRPGEGFELTSPEIRAGRRQPFEQTEMEGMPRREMPTGRIGAGVGTTLEGMPLEEARQEGVRRERQTELLEGKPTAPPSGEVAPEPLVAEDRELYGGLTELHAGVSPGDLMPWLREKGLLRAEPSEGLAVEREPKISILGKFVSPERALRDFPGIQSVPERAKVAIDQIEHGAHRAYKDFIDPARRAAKAVRKGEGGKAEERRMIGLLFHGDDVQEEYEFRDGIATVTRSLDPTRTGQRVGDDDLVQPFSAEAQEVYRLSREMFADQLAQVNAYRASIKLKPVSERIGYLPHRFTGAYEVLIGQPEGDKITYRATTYVDGGQERRFFDTEDAAIRHANAILKDNPDADVVVGPKMFHWTHNGAMPLSAANYFRLSDVLEKAMQKTQEEVGAEVMKGTFRIARPERKGKFWGHALQRKGAAGYDLNFDKLMPYYAWGVQRYMALDAFQRGANQDLGRFFGMEGSARAEDVVDVLRSGKAPRGNRALQALMARYVDDMMGRQTEHEAGLDALLSKAGEPFPFLDKWLGLSKPYAYRRGVQKLSKGVVWAKLGNLSSGIVNLTQSALNTYPVLKERWFAVGLKHASQAYYDHYILGKDTEDWRILEELGISLYVPKYEGVVSAASDRTSKILLCSFNSAEKLNRAIAGLGGYHRALHRGRGKPEGISPEALREGKQVIEQTQFRYDIASKPEILRGPLTGVAGMFKTYAIKELEFALDLTADFAAGRDRGALPRYLGVSIALGGALGVPGITLLADVADLLTGKRWLSEARQFLHENLPDEHLADALSYGIAGLVGADISWRVGPGDLFPTSLEDLQGPIIGTLVRGGKPGARLLQAGIRGGEGYEARDWEELAREISPGAVRHLQGAMEVVREIAGIEAEPVTGYRGRTQYEPTGGERVLRGLGVRTLREAKESDVRALTAVDEQERVRFRAQAIDGLAKALQEGDVVQGQNLLEEAARQGEIVTARDVEAEMQKKAASRLGRTYLGIPKNQRERFLQRAEAFGLGDVLEELEPEVREAAHEKLRADILDGLAGSREEKVAAWKRIRELGWQTLFPGQTRKEVEATAARRTAAPETYEELSQEVERKGVQEEILNLYGAGQAQEAWAKIREYGGFNVVFKGRFRTREAFENEARRRHYKKTG